MQRNIGNWDKSIRVIVGTVIISLGFYYHGWWGVFGIIPIVTAAIGTCPLYHLLGINTFRKGWPPAPTAAAGRATDVDKREDECRD